MAKTRAPGAKPQRTNLLRAQCEACGLLFRITARWCSPVMLCPDATCAGRVYVAD